MKNIIFDLGGVIINLDMPRTYQAFAQLAQVAEIPEYSYETQHQLFKDFEVGAITVDEFVQGMRDLLGQHATEQQIVDGWNAMLLDIPVERLQLLERLKGQYRTFLFSNTNQLHYDAFNRYIQQTHGIDALDRYFDKAYYSHIMGMRKPDAAAFQRILDENGLKAEETLFLDDTPGHLEGAKLLGINTQLVTEEHGILEIFNEN